MFRKRESDGKDSVEDRIDDLRQGFSETRYGAIGDKLVEAHKTEGIYAPDYNPGIPGPKDRPNSDMAIQIMAGVVDDLRKVATKYDLPIGVVVKDFIYHQIQRLNSGDETIAVQAVRLVHGVTGSLSFLDLNDESIEAIVTGCKTLAKSQPLSPVASNYALQLMAVADGYEKAEPLPFPVF